MYTLGAQVWLGLAPPAASYGSATGFRYPGPGPGVPHEAASDDVRPPELDE